MENLSWKKTVDAYFLTSPSEELIKLCYDVDIKKVFWIKDDEYVVKRSGLWNQRYTVYKSNQEVLWVSHDFWGSKGKIKFSDGTQYESDYKYMNTLTLRFFDGESEILSYHVGREEKKRKAIFNPGIALVDTDTILMLSALGMVMFQNLLDEFSDGCDET